MGDLNRAPAVLLTPVEFFELERTEITEHGVCATTAIERLDTFDQPHTRRGLELLHPTR